jgi:hypothetical protein
MNKKKLFYSIVFIFFSPLFLSRTNTVPEQAQNDTQLEKSIDEAKKALNKTRTIAQILGITTLTYFFCRGEKNNIRFLRKIPSFPKLADRACSYSLPILSILWKIREKEQSNRFFDLQKTLIDLKNKALEGNKETSTKEKNLQENKDALLTEKTKLLEKLNNLENALTIKTNQATEANQRVYEADSKNITLSQEIDNKDIQLKELQEALIRLSNENKSQEEKLKKNTAELEALKTTLNEKACLPQTTIDLKPLFQTLKTNGYSEDQIQFMLENPQKLNEYFIVIMEQNNWLPSQIASDMEELNEKKS